MKCESARSASVAVMAAVIFLAAAGEPARAQTLDDAAERYRPYLIQEIGDALAGARLLQDRVAAKDLDGAKKAWIAARIGWERAEVFTSGFVADLDERIDAWPDALMGFHAIEAKLFGAGALDVTDQTKVLILNLADLDVKIHHIPLGAQKLLNGAARLAYEVGESKADGGESRYSGTSLDDMRNNVAGLRLAYGTIFKPALDTADAGLAKATADSIEQLSALLAVKDLRGLEPAKLRAKSEELVIALQKAAPKIGLRAPALEDLIQ
jgi:iron uptake system component EfeO